MNKTDAAFLKFNPKLNQLTKGKELRHGLSAVVQVGDTLWVTNDETISLERLSRRNGNSADEHNYGQHKQFALGDYLCLPAPSHPRDKKKMEEADIEGLDYRDGYLWLVGSHSLKRSEPKKSSVEKNFKRLAKLNSDGNRHLLARIPLVQSHETYMLAKDAGQNRDERTAARLPGGATGNLLTEALTRDEHLQRFLTIPGKDNGFDIEGLAVAGGGRVFVGLRGPVLSGWAVVLELRLEVDKEKPAELKLKSMNSNHPRHSHNPTYRKHFLALGGLGIRDLCVHGSDLLILAGPTMALDGPVTIFRWKGGARPKGENLVSGSGLQKVIDVPYGRGVDQAEGMTLFSPDGGKASSVLIVYDSASEGRQTENGSVRMDIFALPE